MTIDFEKSNRATKRKRRIRNSTSKYDFENSRIDFKIRHENFDDNFERETRIRNTTRKLRNLARNATQTKKLHDERQTNDEKLTHTKRTHTRTKRPENAHQRHTLQMGGCFNKIKYLLFLINKNNTSKTRVYLVYNACNFLCIMNSYTSSLLNQLYYAYTRCILVLLL